MVSSSAIRTYRRLRKATAIHLLTVMHVRPGTGLKSRPDSFLGEEDLKAPRQSQIISNPHKHLNQSVISNLVRHLKHFYLAHLIHSSYL